MGQAENEVRPILAITMGDSAGIGPEITAKVLTRPDIRELCRPLVVGDARILDEAVRITGGALLVRAVREPQEGRYRPGEADVLDLGDVDPAQLVRGTVSIMGGEAAYSAVVAAARLCLSGQAHALATGPLNKEALNLAGHHYSGHTELLADLCGVKGTVMMLASGNLRIAHVTTHISLRQACAAIEPARILRVIRLTDDATRRMGVERPRLAVAALNPHAGDGGLFGDEERITIAPAIRSAQEEGLSVVGPLAPDTVFYRALQGEFDAVVAMYHDQGHIPLKMVGFKEGVNITLGLPIIRTSVDHGTAFDKAGKGVADDLSLYEAIKVAAKMAKTCCSSEPPRARVGRRPRRGGSLPPPAQ